MILGVTFTKETIFIPVFSLFLLFILLFILGAKYGRVFCSHGCPVHLYLETMNLLPGRNNVPFLLAAISPLILAQSCVTAVFSYREQLVMYSSEPFPQRVLLFYLGTLSLFTAIFIFYREHFCRFACPYGIFQNLTSTENTALVRFDNSSGNCTNCRACDEKCPFHLDVREESDDTFCSNCNLCHESCVTVLGKGREVLHLTIPDKPE